MKSAQCLPDMAFEMCHIQYLSMMQVDLQLSKFLANPAGWETKLP